MNRLIVVLAALALFSFRAEAQKNPPRCNIGADPVNPNRQLADDEETVVNPTDKTITMVDGHSRKVYCTLPMGAPVVVKKATGIAVWVWGCGNDLLTVGWIPKRFSLMGPIGATGAMGPQGERGGIGPPGPPGRDGRDFTPPVVKKGGFPWRAAGVAAGAAAALVGGYFILRPDGRRPFVATLPPTTP